MGKRRSHCRQCGYPDTTVGRISKRGLCGSCAQDNMTSNARQLATKSGPAYNLWLKRQTAGREAWQGQLKAQQAQAERQRADGASSHQQ